LDPRTTRTLPNGRYPEYWTSQQRQIWEREHGDNDEGAAVSPPPTPPTHSTQKNMKTKPVKAVKERKGGKYQTGGILGAAIINALKNGGRGLTK